MSIWIAVQSGLKNLREHALMELMVVSLDTFTVISPTLVTKNKASAKECFCMNPD